MRTTIRAVLLDWLALRYLEIQHDGTERDLYTGIGRLLVSAHVGDCSCVVYSL